MNLLLDSQPLVVIPELAELIGLNESIVLQQIHYWIQKSENEHDGHVWVYNSAEEWAEQFPFWSTDTVRRTLRKLENENFLVTGNYNTDKRDRTKWYRINYEELQNAIGQSAQLQLGNMHKPLPETTTERVKGKRKKEKEESRSDMTEEKYRELMHKFLSFFKMPEGAASSLIECDVVWLKRKYKKEVFWKDNFDHWLKRYKSGGEETIMLWAIWCKVYRSILPSYPDKSILSGTFYESAVRFSEEVPMHAVENYFTDMVNCGKKKFKWVLETENFRSWQGTCS